MIYRIVFYLLIALICVAPRPVAADPGIPVVYDTVDSVEIKNHDLCDSCSVQENLVIVIGVVAGQSGPSTHQFDFGSNVDMATRCERLAVIAMSKPGKYQFGIASDSVSNGPTRGHGDCKLILVTP